MICEHASLKRSCNVCMLEDEILELRRERDAYKAALSIMDDRKNVMLPRSHMAKIAKDVLDEYAG